MSRTYARGDNHGMSRTKAARAAARTRFAAWLTAAMSAANLDDVALAGALSRPDAPVTVLRVTGWRTGKAMPYTQSLPGLAAALGVDLAVVATAAGRPPSDLVRLRFVTDPHGCLAARIRAWREGVGLTVAQVAPVAGVGVGTWSRIESGSHLPSAVTLIRIADLMGADPADLAAAARPVASVATDLDRAVATAGRPLATLLRQRRTDLGLTVAEVATAVGAGTNTLSHWERGTSIPDSFESLLALAVALRLDRARVLSCAGLPGADAEALAAAVSTPPRGRVGTLGEELRRARIRAGYTVAMTGRLLGIHHTWVSRVEHDHIRPDVARIAELARMTEAELPRLVAAYRR